MQPSGGWAQPRLPAQGGFEGLQHLGTWPEPVAAQHKPGLRHLSRVAPSMAWGRAAWSQPGRRPNCSHPPDPQVGPCARAPRQPRPSLQGSRPSAVSARVGAYRAQRPSRIGSWICAHPFAAWPGAHTVHPIYLTRGPTSQACPHGSAVPTLGRRHIPRPAADWAVLYLMGLTFQLYEAATAQRHTRPPLTHPSALAPQGLAPVSAR